MHIRWALQLKCMHTNSVTNIVTFYTKQQKQTSLDAVNYWHTYDVF